MDELLDLVDDNDQVIDQIRRSQSTGVQNIRVINIFVTTPDGKIIVPLRSANRRIFPNCFDFSVGGFVEAGDTYEETAYKELAEELGLTNTPIKEIGYFKPCDNVTFAFSKLYTCQYDGQLDDLRFDKHGIQQLYAFTRTQLRHMLETTPEKFKGDYEQVFGYYETLNR